jgi:hypothetical protein
MAITSKIWPAGRGGCGEIHIWWPTRPSFHVDLRQEYLLSLGKILSFRSPRLRCTQLRYFFFFGYPREDPVAGLTAGSEDDLLPTPRISVV